MGPGMLKEVQMLAPLKHYNAFTHAEKKAMQKMVDTEFKAERTGLSFKGWKDCKDTEGPVDLYILTSDKPVSALGARIFGKAEIGNGTEYNSHAVRLVGDGPTHMFFAKVPREDGTIDFELTKLYALHEFGHVAGLRHEHIRPEADLDELCELDGGAGTEAPGPLTENFSAYDSFSIMNYCFLHAVQRISGFHFQLPKSNDRVKYFSDRNIFTKKLIGDSWDIRLKPALSQGDVRGLKCLYVFSEAEFHQNCHSKAKP